ncbi:LAQU0S02e05864g1_1 [Lachancea quebecensis]|uniref:LAQU0S02e05864g1_1 n=1 Tax=Lachancea quebecensis TaxID=1654605 RepID=A0A0P1KM78_9SACH|nr:LAQU0S02e05864g1_1 [Lachancea quebecensis]
MSLIVYGDRIDDENNESVVLQDPGSRSLVVMNQESGEISLLRQIRGPQNGSRRKGSARLISSYFCPQCGSEIGTGYNFAPSTSTTKKPSGSFVHKNYFNLLEHRSSQTQLPSIESPSAIPASLFTPGYYHRFFKELSLLGSGARGSVFKVEHVLMDNHLGVYALKKIHIGNNLSWLERGMKEVKFLSALTHSSVNLITYNHVWLEMDKASGIVKARDGQEVEPPESVPCVFILQQFCCGGNLEEVVLNEVFEKFTDHESPEARKKRFKLRRSTNAHNSRLLGLTTCQILSIVHDVASGLKELHDLNIIHRDLKPSNCLLLESFESETERYGDKSFPTVVISDFGESQLGGQPRSATGATGTLEFSAPEVVITNCENSSVDLPQFSFQSDMYSLGMVCYFLVFGELPFGGQQSLLELKRNIKLLSVTKEGLSKKHNDMKLRPIDTSIFALIEKLLSPDALSRPTAGEVKAEIAETIDRLKDDMPPIFNEKQELLSDDESELQSIIAAQSEVIPAERRLSYNTILDLANVATVLAAVYLYNEKPFIPSAFVVLLALSSRAPSPSRKVFLITELTLLIVMHFAL